MYDTYNCDYLKHNTFRFNLIDFLLNTDSPSQFCVFYRTQAFRTPCGPVDAHSWATACGNQWPNEKGGSVGTPDVHIQWATSGARAVDKHWWKCSGQAEACISSCLLCSCILWITTFFAWSEHLDAGLGWSFKFKCTVLQWRKRLRLR